MTVSILDCGTGNIGSVVNMLKYLNVPTRVINSADGVAEAERLLLPGVGHWDHGIGSLSSEGLRGALDEAALVRKIPVLGICLGMQMLLQGSEEGRLPGLGWVPGHVRRFRFSQDQAVTGRLRVPHMGWNVASYDERNTLCQGFQGEYRFYFVHGFHAADVPSSNVFMRCHYGHDFVCGVHHENIWGVQFHPEKSHRFGMQLLRNFAGLQLC